MWREASLKAGLRFGVSSHADSRGWNYMYGSQTADASGPLAGVPYVGRNPALVELYNAPKSQNDAPPDEWQQKWLLRHTELVDKYHPDFLYFDSGIPHGNYGMKLIAHYLNDNAARHDGKVDAVVNVKAGSFVHDYERGIPLVLQEKPFQSETSLSGWFYMTHHSRNDSASDCKDTPTVIHMLSDVVSKNGCFLINMPQRGDGSLFPECEQVLDELAKWMPINGEAIFATRPWTTFGEGPTVLKTKGMNELQQPLTVNDIRFTQTKDRKTVYAIVCGVPTKPVVIASLASVANRISEIKLLGSNEAIHWKATPGGVEIQPVSHWPCQYAVVFKIAMKEP